jgi:hypothetical protein
MTFIDTPTRAQYHRYTYMCTRNCVPPKQPPAVQSAFVAINFCLLVAYTALTRPPLAPAPLCQVC